MKRRIRKTLSLALALIMLLSMVPLVYAAEDADEFAGLETLEEIPFEFVLEPGDLPYELLREAVLDVRDIPACIDHALAEERGHVNRLYLQEPDDCTVMFQNRDGSKTIYLFSHPVKGMTASTVATVQINGTSVSFSGDNAITSRLAEITNFNIGSAEIAYLPVGVLSENGVNITEDVRSWTLAESIDVVQAYNISSEAAAEYAASVAVPETDAAATAAAAPGITITPNDPAPLGGMTVMSISYSDLAGVMSFKSVSANKHLTLHPNNLASLMMYSGILNPYSRWVVSYDSYFGYTLTNLYHPESKYIGFDEDGDFAIAPIDDMIEAFRVDIVSSSNNSVNVTISYGGFAIDSTASLYLNDPDATSYPTSCQWTIYTKTDYEPVQSITTSRIRTVNAEEPFYAEYTTNPAEPTYSDIKLHYASNNQVVPTDSDFDMDDLCAYVIAEPGMYQVYYKDSSTGVRSANFWLNVVQNVRKITPASSVRIEQSGVGFYLDYTVLPELANNYSISLYYASNNEEVDYEEDEDGEPDYYYIDTPGIYSVYYKDSISGVRSDNFTLLITGISSSINEHYTHTIQPLNNSNLYLTMTANYHMVGNKKVYNESSNSISLTSMPTSGYEPLHNISRTFIINPYSSGFNISATLPTYQYLDVPSNQDTVYRSGTTTYRFSQITTSVYPQIEDTYDVDYHTTYIRNQNNTLYYGSGTTISTSGMETNGTAFRLCPVNITSTDTNVNYYIIVCGVLGNDVKALKYNSSTNSYSVETYSPNDAEDFIWKFTQVGINAHLIKQTTNYWCGYTTVLQVLYGKGVVNSSWGSTVHQQIKFIANKYETSDEPASNVGIDDKFNENFPYGQYYQNSVDGNKPSKDIVKQNIRGSLNAGWCPFFLTRAAGIPYRYSSDVGVGAHFICIVGYDPASDCVIISNCHFVDNVFGIYAIPFDDFYDALAILYWH